MNEGIKIELVGGPYDGKKHTIPYQQPVVYFYRLKTLPIIMCVTDAPYDPDRNVEIVSYIYKGGMRGDVVLYHYER